MDADPIVDELRPRGGLKWSSYPPDVLAAWVAEMDFGLAEPIAAALHAAIEREDTGYPYDRLERAVATAATGFWEERFGWQISPERVFAVPDVVEGIRRAIVHLTSPGTPVVLHTPVYFPFFSMVERAGRSLVEVPCTPDETGRYWLDLDGIVRALDEGAGSIVLCNPWNPIGRAFSLAELEAVVEVAASRSARLIVDEVHAPLVRAGVRHSVAATIAPETVITVTSASKAWNIPGLKCAQVVLTNDADAEVWSDYFTPDKVGVSTFGLVANAAAYADGGDWLEVTTARIDFNRDLLAGLVADRLPRLGLSPLEGTYLAWLDFRPYRLDRPGEFLLEQARVALSEGDPFGVGGRGHARLNFATPAPILTAIIDRIAVSVEGEAFT